MRKKACVVSLYRYDLRIYDGSREQKETFARGTGVPCHLWHYAFRLSFYF